MANPKPRDSESSLNIEKAKVRVVTTPLKKRTANKARPTFRDINEDDDGYHPYCDGPDAGCKFEEDPWY